MSVSAVFDRCVSMIWTVWNTMYSALNNISWYWSVVLGLIVAGLTLKFLVMPALHGSVPGSLVGMTASERSPGAYEGTESGEIVNQYPDGGFYRKRFVRTFSRGKR